MQAEFLLTKRGGELESSQRTVPPELSRPGKCDVHNNVLVPSARIFIIFIIKMHSCTDRNSNQSDNYFLELLLAR